MIIQYVIIGLVILCLFVAVINYYSNTPLLIKLLVLPFTIIFSIYTLYFVYEKLGSPILGIPQGKFVYVFHKPVSGGDSIILWASQDNKDRLYIFDYTRENMKKLEQVREKVEDGILEDVVLQLSENVFRIIDDETIEDELEQDEKIKQENRQRTNGF